MPFSWDDTEQTPTTVSRHVDVTPEKVFATLADGWLYPLWVVGAVHVRAVDEGWPQTGTRIHHEVGGWPVTVKDSTEVVDEDAPRRLVLRGRAWPFGEALIELLIDADDTGSTITMNEAPAEGAAAWLDNPLQRKVLVARNRESLLRLAAIAENRK